MEKQMDLKFLQDFNTILNLAEWEKEGFKFDISNYENIQTLTRLFIDQEAYIETLLFLLDKQYSNNNELYQWYEKKYIETYVELFYEKEKFISWLHKQQINLNDFKDWVIVFSRKEVLLK